MASASGTENPDVAAGAVAALERWQPRVAAAIKQTPWEFEFFQIMRWLIRLRPDRSQPGRFHHPAGEVARYSANPSAAFPASEIQGLTWPASWNPGGAGDEPVAIMVNFMGLFGPLGALPLYYSEFIRHRGRAGDTVFRSFLDIFNHRLVSLFYRAWEKYRFAVANERGERDRMTQYLLDLIGLGTKGLSSRQRPLRDESLIFYSGLFSLLPRSALALEQILSDYFDVPIVVEQFQGQWYPLEASSQCKFDRGDSYSEQVGVGAIVGDEVWDPQSGIRVRVGPLTLRQYLDFLPEGSAYKPLKALTRFFTNGELSFETQLVLKRDHVPNLELGGESESGPRLGWVTWAKNVPMTRDPDETLLRI